MHYPPDRDNDGASPATLREVAPGNSPYARNGHRKGVQIPATEEERTEAGPNGRVDPWLIEALMSCYND